MITIEEIVDFTKKELKEKDIFPGKQTVYHQFRLYQKHSYFTEL